MNLLVFNTFHACSFLFHRYVCQTQNVTVLYHSLQDACVSHFWLVSMHACTSCTKCYKKKTIFHNGFVCYSTASCYSPLQTKHFVILLFSLQFILLNILYIYLKNNWKHCLNLVFKHMGMFQKLHIKKSDILIVT